MLQFAGELPMVNDEKKKYLLKHFDLNSITFFL